MKRIAILTMLCIGFVGFSTKSFAQSTQINPFDGATHTYGFADVEANASYEFYVVASDNHLGTVITDFGQFVDAAGDPLTDGKGTIGAVPGNASIKIKWSETLSTTYPDGVYLFLKVTAQGSTCGVGNYKGIYIDAVPNDFNVAVVGPATDPDCNDITGIQPIINKTVATATDEYDPGKTSFTFTLTRENSTNDWSGAYTVSCSDGTVPFTINTDAATTGDKSGTITNESNKDVVVTVEMINTPGANPTFTLTMTSASDDVTGLTDQSLESDSQTFNLMPKIGNFIAE
ncbi:hypothetical protein EO244_02260 [Ancylomarina salipaludis]|uniref:Dystroglycan-type cadherin-like domain-containing protein n=1 Tax=Ancylomarina salipaludis TaxID=2501299 RepID=A0A4Q1JR91_9BACT|nr:hypothetical protein [Ancylomarina salipaludis]RXQ97728.1 hypothetical protein EO244_02260 [Ancylomarina salipaludis]